MNWVVYLKDGFGLKADAKALTGVELSGLPLYIANSLKLYHGHIDAKRILWAEILPGLDYTPEYFVTLRKLLKDRFKKTVIFVFQKLESWNRKRLIERRISFIQPGKQLFLPELLIELSDVIEKNVAPGQAAESLSFPAQYLLIYHLLKNKLDNKSFQTIAEETGYSKMTISRAVKELRSNALADVAGVKEKSVQFKFHGKELWEKALPYMRTPVMETYFFDEFSNHKTLLESSEHGLADYGMLSSPKIMSYAISKQAFRKLKDKIRSTAFNKQHGDQKIEVWHYDPKCLVSPSVKMVDRISLYLSLKDEADERIGLALKQMMNDVKW